MRVRRREDRRLGAAAVEMAMISPVFLALVLGMIETSRLGMASQLITTAAREGCRVAILPGKVEADVQTRINVVLAGSGIPVGTITPTPSNWDTSSGGTAITVTISVPYRQVAWFSPSLYLTSATITASATMSSERP
jgi:Flp pilus assembly protein TadG